MRLVSIETQSYRNLEDRPVDTDAERVFLVGENGQGKSNFLDAAYTLCFGSSFRNALDGEAARRGEKAWGLGAYADDGFGSARSIRVRWEEGAKRILEDGKRVADRKELVARNPAVVFCHEDFTFASGEPERRRFFFDQTASLASAEYVDRLRSYRRALRMRNASLKDGRVDVVEVLDEQVAEHGLALTKARAALAVRFDPVFADRFEAVSRIGRRVGLEYRPSWPVELGAGEIVERLRSKRREELTMATTLSGPHRDRFRFSQEGAGDFSALASTGQLRLLALTLRVAQAVFAAEETGRPPILLLDDVLLELDPEKRRRFMEALPATPQAFFTFLPGEPWEAYRTNSTLVYWTDDGRFARKEG